MSVTYVFSPNTRIKSAEVNQDFTDCFNLDRCKIGPAVADTLNDGAATTIAGSAEYIDTNSMHDGGGAIPYAVSIKKNGTYLLLGQIYFVANATGYRAAVIKDDGGNNLALGVYSNAGAAVGTAVSVSCIKVLTTANYVYLQGTQTSGGPLNDIAGEANTHFDVIKLSDT